MIQSCMNNSKRTFTAEERKNARPMNLHPLTDVPENLIVHNEPGSEEPEHYCYDEDGQLRILIYPRRNQ